MFRFDKIFYYTIAVATFLDGKLDLSKPAVSEYDLRTQNIICELIPLLNVPEHVNLSKMRFAAKQLTGVFFEPTDQWKWVITHPKIYQLCAKSLYIHLNKHMIQFASADLVMNYIRTQNCTESTHELSVKVASESYNGLARKYIQEIMSGKMKQCIQNPCFGDAEFVKVWFEQLAEFDYQQTIFGPTDAVLERSLFYWACYYGQGHVVRGVLELDRVDLHDEEWFQQEMRQGLYAACASNSPGSKIAVKCLVEQGIDINACEVYDETCYGKVFGEEFCYLMFLEAPPIHVAARFGHPDTVELLLEKGADHSVVTKDESTPLHRAASRLDSAAETVIEILIKKGANREARNTKGRKPIHEAVSGGNKCAVSALAVAGVNVNENMANGRSFLSVAIQSHYSELVDYLIMKGVNANGTPHDDFTPLQHAIRIGDTSLVDRLISYKGAEVNKLSRAGMGALHLAVLYREEEIVEKLIANGADVNLTGRGSMTPLHIAAKNGFYKMCDILLGAGAKPEKMTSRKETALVIAAKEGHQTVVWLLLREGMELEGGNRDQDMYGPFMGMGVPFMFGAQDIGGPFGSRDFFKMFHH